MTTQHAALQGLWLPLVTPFRNGQIDGPSLRRLVTHYAGAPVDGFILGATTGEGLTLDIAELERIAALTRAEVRASGRPIAIYLGLSGSNTAKLCETLDETAAWPIDGYLISTPYYARPSQRGMLQHFTVLAERAAHPLMIYNIPYRTGVNLGNETMLQLADHGNIVGLKDCCAVREQSVELLRRRPDVRAFVAGLEEWIIRALATFNVTGERREDRVGVWVRRPDKGPGHEDKIAAIGVRLRRWVSFHGISLNVEPDLSHFDAIVPCGVTDPRYGVTSLVDLGLPVTLADVDVALRQAFEEVFGSSELRLPETMA